MDFDFSEDERRADVSPTIGDLQHAIPFIFQDMLEEEEEDA